MAQQVSTEQSSAASVPEVLAAAPADAPEATSHAAPVALNAELLPQVPVFPIRAPREAETLVEHELGRSDLPQLRGGVRVVWIPRTGIVADESTKFSVLNASGHPVVFGFLAGDPDPGLITRAARISEAAAEAIGPALGAAVLRPIAQWSIAGRACAIYRWHRPIGGGVQGRVQRWWLSGAVLRWLRGVAARETGPASAAEPAFAACLEHVQGRSILPAEMRGAAAGALARLSAKQWRPRHQIDHNDFHCGNLLLNAGGRAGRTRGEHASPFVVIDWPGANLSGFGLYDLVRCAHSLRLPARVLRREALAHCAAHGCEPIDAAGHLLAALGRLGMNLGEYPEQRYAAMAARCWKAMHAAGLVQSSPFCPTAGAPIKAAAQPAATV